MHRDPRDPQAGEHADAEPAEPSGEARARGVGTPTAAPAERGNPPVGSIDPARSTALVTAYVDGVAELSPAERHEVEALLSRDPGARAEADAVHALLDRLRALPPEGDDPDWAAMERSIRQAVATAPPRPWWRRWQWLVPALTCATAAAVLLVIWPRAISPRPPHLPDAELTEHPTAGPPDEASVVALWLDGTEVDVDVSAPDELGDLGIALGEPEAPQPIEDADEVGLLPPTDLAWVDTLDDAALDRVERWLADPEDPIGSSRRHDSQTSPGKIPEKSQQQRKI